MFTKADFFVWVVIVAVVFLCGSCMVLIDKADQKDWETRNRDPKGGWVWLDRSHNSAKQCDGKTLLYYGYGAASGMTVRSSVPNSEECV